MVGPVVGELGMSKPYARYLRRSPGGVSAGGHNRAKDLHQRYEVTMISSRVRGPWTPSTRLSSMSLVALGPLIMVNGRVGSR